MPYPLRSNTRSRLGEGSVRRFAACAFAFSIILFLLLSPHDFSRAQGIGPETGALARAVKSHIASVTSWKESEIEVERVGCLNDSDTCVENPGIRVSPNAKVSTLRSLILPVEVLSDGKVTRTFWVQAEVEIRATLVQATRKLAFGSAIGVDDVKEALTEVIDPRSDYLRTRDLALGKVLRRSLSPGDPLTRDSVANPVLIRSGETVRLLFQEGSISLATVARAEQDGRIGQVIRVRNLDFSRTVKALVTGRKEVRIE